MTREEVLEAMDQHLKAADAYLNQLSELQQKHGDSFSTEVFKVGLSLNAAWREEMAKYRTLANSLD